MMCVKYVQLDLSVDRRDQAWCFRKHLNQRFWNSKNPIDNHTSNAKINQSQKVIN